MEVIEDHDKILTKDVDKNLIEVYHNEDHTHVHLNNLFNEVKDIYLTE